MHKIGIRHIKNGVDLHVERTLDDLAIERGAMEIADTNDSAVSGIDADPAWWKELV